MPWLKHTKTGDIYPYTTELAKRSDMIETLDIKGEKPIDKVEPAPPEPPVKRPRKTRYTPQAAEKRAYKVPAGLDDFLNDETS